MEFEVNLDLLVFLNSKDLTIEDLIFLFLLEKGEAGISKFFVENDRLHITCIQKLMGRGYIDILPEHSFYTEWYITSKGTELINQSKLFKTQSIS